MEDIDVRHATKRPGNSRGRVALGAALILLGAAATPARAQFSFFGPSEASPQDIYETIADHGFRLVGPLYRNGRVYLADVVDRRQRRERLVIAAESGQIIQRFLVDLGGPDRRAPSVAQPAPPRDDSFFSHLTRGWDDDAPPRPPLGLDGQGNEFMPSAPLAPPPRRREPPRVVTRTETGPITPPAAVTATPLPSGTPQSAKPDATTGSAPAGTPPTSGRGTTVSTDPLRIPGSRPADTAPKPTPAAAVASKANPSPAPAASTPPAAAPQPKPAAAPSTDVPVAPLD